MQNRITIQPSRKLSSMKLFYGIFFEDISNAGDGGLYAELIRNRAFEFSPMDHPDYDEFTSWEKVEEEGAKVSWCVLDKCPRTEKNPHYLVLDFEKIGKKAGIRNLGFFSGIPVVRGKSYHLSFYAKADSKMPVYVSLENAQRNIARNDFMIEPKEWNKYECTFYSDTTDHECRLMIGAECEGKLYLDFVSLFPTETFNDHINGMRKDLAEMIAGLKPRFLRFPGGCPVHLGTLNENDRNSMYRWKNTLGNMEDRPVKSIRWRGNQTFGLGFMEFFQFCEELGIEPVPVLPAGYNPHTRAAVPLDEMQPWIEDALDLIEFANGSTETVWGERRAKLGHPAPFNLKMLAVGNEEEGKGFWDRYDIIHKAVKEKYPEIELINNASFSTEGPDYETGWENARRNKSDYVDEHYYVQPEWLIENSHRYDFFERGGPSVFLGEFSSTKNT